MRRPESLLLGIFSLYSCVNNTSKTPKKEPLQQPVSGAISNFTWTTELCENTGTYNPKKYSDIQLQGTYELWFKFSGIALETDGTVFSPEEISSLDTNELIDEYKNRKKYYEQSEIINTAYWQKLKQMRMNELEDEFDLKKITIQSYKNTSVLKENRFSNICPDFVKVLTSQDTSQLMIFWKEFSEKQSLKNGSPGKFMERFYEKYNSKDRILYAKVDLITFGWWNCVNNALTHVNRDGQMEDEFNKLFSDIRSECDEP